MDGSDQDDSRRGDCGRLVLVAVVYKDGSK